MYIDSSQILIIITSYFHIYAACEAGVGKQELCVLPLTLFKSRLDSNK